MRNGAHGRNGDADPGSSGDMARTDLCAYPSVTQAKESALDGLQMAEESDMLLWLLKETTISIPMIGLVGVANWIGEWELGVWGVAAWAGVAMLAWVTLDLLSRPHSEYTVTLAGSHATFVTAVCAIAIWRDAVDWSGWVLLAILAIPWAASIISLARRGKE